MSPTEPTIDPAVFTLAPGFRALSIIAVHDGSPIGDRSAADRALEEAYQVAASGGPAWAEAHLEAWRDAFRAFGAKPKRTPTSAEALRQRFERDGGLPRISPVVDLYNAVSLRFAVPVGGENLVAYAGNPRLVRATGDELFDTVKDGQPATESPEPGEVVWRDDLGVTCRRWNWRQGVRTRITEDTTRMWFILESLGPMPVSALEEAGDCLVRGMRAMFPDIRIDRAMLRGSEESV